LPRFSLAGDESTRGGLSAPSMVFTVGTPDDTIGAAASREARTDTIAGRPRF
jgi:hypothetical protein